MTLAFGILVEYWWKGPTLTDSNSHSDEYKIAAYLFEQGKYEEAFDRYRALAEAGSTTAQVLLGWTYHEGRGIRKDLDEARRWYEKAADAGGLEGNLNVWKRTWIVTAFAGKILYRVTHFLL